MAPNDGEDPLGSILRPLGKKMGKKREKITMPQNSNFRQFGHRFFPKNGSHRYGSKSRWGPPSVHLEAIG